MTHFITDQDDTNETLMLHEIARHLSIVFDRRAQHLGLTRAQWRVLCILRREPGINQTQVAELMEIEPITLVRQLDRMERAGWIERKPDPNDRRANQLYLTEKVDGIVKEMRSIAVNVRRDALKSFLQTEHTQLLDYLKRMKANIVTMLEEETEDHHAA